MVYLIIILLIGYIAYLIATGEEKIVIFDTETSGVGKDSVVLSISWQFWKGKKLVERKTIYFDWPEDESKVSPKAIEVNGLTKERLKELGTSKNPASDWKYICDLMRSVDLLVAHNATFDIARIESELKRYKIQIPTPWPDVFDTMKVATPMKVATFSDGRPKYPKLIELAEFLKIDYSDIEFHQSDSDVELTRRCWEKLETIIKD